MVLGKKLEVASHKNRIAEIAWSFGGVMAGERNGERGYMMTFVIAYIRVRNNVVPYQNKKLKEFICRI